MASNFCKSAKLPPIAIAALVALAAAALRAADPPPRAAPPSKWTPETLNAFFDDAREALDGERPAAAPTDVSQQSESSGDARGDHFEWSRLISADALDTEVKRLASGLATPLATAEAFKSGGNEVCRAAFNVLAMLFAVIEDYDGDVRWQRDAAALRDAFARAAANCKSASDQSFAEATERRLELEDLIRGGRPANKTAEPLEKWSAASERGPLMQRMQLALLERINPQLADARTFARGAADVRHEAEMLAALAEIIRREEYEFWDDETFNEYADELGAAAADLTRSAADEDYEAARAAAGRAGQSCAACHDGYRG